MTLGLAMIVKNEAGIIERCLASIKPHIDYWTIIDTGSTDTTTSVISKTLDGVPGWLGREEWVDFGHNRTSLLKHARGKTDWIITLDADMVVKQVAALPDNAEAGMVRYTGSLDYAQALLLRGDLEWRYVGRTHEYVHTDHVPCRQVAATGWLIAHHGDGMNRAEKYERDVELLTDDTQAGDPRSMFYLAESLKNLGRNTEAIEWYDKRVLAGGWDEEVFVAQLRSATLSDADEQVSRLLIATTLRPSRAEPWYYLAKHLNGTREWAAARTAADKGLALGYPNDVLFIERWIYEWGLLLERSVAAYWLDDRERCKADSVMLLGALPMNVREQVEKNLGFCE